ncbi:6-hydroxynicotinate 3-monooxygenase isoform X2 [Macadamia integrifolia]|uniref:6-hydroxynicotinate 3-monooxygenase isoform X2 n=1 Tax=Macadamia integrifolia TaxID=60698 RepID=UPI001C4FF19C|nr:6-hydroxynicotinate 3-monooxygenase isoform X2 [Macadamia integrifolia]
MEGAGVDRKKTRKPKAVVVGGSIAGLSCAHALIAAGWDVVVLEKSTGPPSSSLTGAGLGLDPLARRFIQSWLDQPQLFHDSTLPLSVDQNKATDSEKKISWTLTRDDNFNFRAAHWVHLHGLLYRALPSHIVLWADGSRSKIRQTFLPSIKLRYSGYYAWRGVHDFTEDENSDTIVGIRKAYPELGHCLYFDMAKGTHCVLYELPNKRMNWLWYVNQPEPELKGNSVTIKVSSEMIKQLHEEAEKTWVPELARVMKETKEPFINVIYDSDPLEQLFWDNVVMVGDAAHPTTPHGLRSTNMSILDAAILGKCLEKWGVDNLGLALKEFQSIQLPIVSKQVLHARRIGRIKQGLTLPDRKNFDPTTATTEDCQELQQKNMPFFADIPSLLGST